MALPALGALAIKEQTNGWRLTDDDSTMSSSSRLQNHLLLYKWCAYRRFHQSFFEPTNHMLSAEEKEPFMFEVTQKKTDKIIVS